jgi:hypothetical protein
MDDAAPAKPEPMEEVVGTMAAASSSSSSSSAAASGPKKEMQPIKTTLTPEVEVYLHLLALMYVMDHGSADEVRCDSSSTLVFAAMGLTVDVSRYPGGVDILIVFVGHPFVFAF